MACLEATFEARDSEIVGRPTRTGLFIPSPLADIGQLFEEIGLGDYGSLADLGSGDGRVVHLASLFTPARGFESDPSLVAVARAQALDLGLRAASFRCGDFLETDLNPFEILYIYPDKPLTDLAAKLGRSYRGRLLAYGPLSSTCDLKVLAEFRLNPGRAVLFQVGD